MGLLYFVEMFPSSLGSGRESKYDYAYVDMTGYHPLFFFFSSFLFSLELEYTDSPNPNGMKKPNRYQLFIVHELHPPGA